MSERADADLVQELEAILSAKSREQRWFLGWLGLALALGILAWAAQGHSWLRLGCGILILMALWQSSRSHLRVSTLRGQATEKILAEAFRRAGKEAQP